MLLTNWLRNKKKSLERWLALSHERRQRSTTHPLARTLLCLEVLEDRITPSSFETLYSFTGGNDGKNPRGAVTVDSNGNLDGTTAGAGANQEGTVFQFNPSSQALTTLYGFSTTSGSTQQGLIQDSSGNFYGTTLNGGSSSDGTVFELSSDGTKFTILHSFTGGTGDGATPQAPLIMDLKGNLYGTTTGGTSNDGTVFELSPDGNGGYKYTTLYFFNGSSDGSSPVGSLLMDSSGNLYGVAEHGGANSDGTVFELSNGSGGYSFSVLHTFAGGTTDGAQPDTNLVMDSKGNLFGTTTLNGASSGGTAFEITASSHTFSTIYNFQRTGSGGYHPNGNTLIDPSGNIYGVAELGGSSRDGTVFELSPTGNLTTLRTFTGTDGTFPVGGLTEDSIGDFYGTTLSGGTNGDGTIFEIQGVITGLTTTKSSNVTATFSTNAQNVTLTANVSTGSGTVNAGTVTFEVLQGTTVIGSATTSGTVSNGQASVSYTLPANLALGTYTIDAEYNPGSGFLSSSDSTHTLTLGAANVTTAAIATPASVPYSNTTSQTIALSASVTDASISTDTVNEGTVTFKVVNSSGITIASLPPIPVSQASAQFTLPAGQAAGNYSIDAIYFDAAGNFIDDGKSDTPGTLQVTATLVTTTPSTPPSTVYSNNAQKIALSANLVEPSDPNVKISEGTVTFTVKDSNGNIVGSAVPATVVAGTTSGGTASANFNLPAAALPGTYTIDVHYDDSAGGLADSGNDTSSTFTVNPASVTTTANPASTVYSTSAQSVKLTAALADTSFPSDVVNEGTVTFTVEDSNGNTVGSPVPGTVIAGTTSGGTASADFSTAGLAAGSYTIAVKYSDTNGNYTDSGDTNSTLTIAGIPVNTAAGADISAIYSPNQQTLALTASVTNPAAPTNTINEGAVIFTILNGTTSVGTTQGSVIDGTASGSFTTPKVGLAAGSYTIAVQFTDPNGNYSDNVKGDTSGTLTIAPANVVTTAGHSDITFNTATQTAVLNATVADTSIPTDTVGEGTVTFKIEAGQAVIGSISAPVSDGQASANFNWPAGRAAGTYTIEASYSDSPDNFTEPVGSGVNNTLTVEQAVVTTTANATSAVYSPNAQNVTLSADVASTGIASASLNAGTVLFTVENGSTVVGSVPGVVSGGVANANFTLPKGLAVGSYNIDVDYSDSNGNFTEPTSGVSAKLTVAAATVATTANNATVVLPNSTSVTLSAIVSDTSNPSDTVGEGSVIFTIMNGQTVIGAPVQGNVSGGIASADFTLPSDLTAGNYTIGVSYTGSNNFSDNPIDDTGATLTVELAPTVTASGNPINDTASLGGTAVFTAAANGSPTPTVQWQVSTDGGKTFTNLSDGTNVSGSTSTTLTLSNVQVSQSGYQYQAVFTNSYGTVHTSAATLTVPFATTVTLNPINQTVIAGKNVTFTAAASGGPTPTVQWQVSTDGGKTFTNLSDGTNVSGSTSASLTLSNVQVSQSGYEYEAVFTQGVGSSATTTTTTAATLTVQYAPTVTLNPKSQTATAGQETAFTAAATSNPAATVQWQVSTDGGKTFSDISGAINPTFTLAGLTTAMSGYEYRAVFTNSVGSTPTSTATLTVNPSALPVITVNPVSQTVTAGASVSFTASANSNPAAAVQWQVSTDGGTTFSNIGGATGTTLTLTGVNPAMNGYEYQAVFSTGAGSAVSIPASLTVNPTSGSSSNSLALNVPPLLALLDQLIGGIETINANDTETVVYGLLGFSLVTAHYDGSGNFIDATLFGFSIPNWVWNL